MDLLPSTDNEVVLARKDIEVLGKSEEELPYLPSSKAEEEMIDEFAEISPQSSGKRKTVDYAAESCTYFSLLRPEMQAITKSFIFKHGKEDVDKIEWNILSESE